MWYGINTLGDKTQNEITTAWNALRDRISPTVVRSEIGRISKWDGAHALALRNVKRPPMDQNGRTPSSSSNRRTNLKRASVNRGSCRRELSSLERRTARNRIWARHRTSANRVLQLAATGSGPRANFSQLFPGSRRATDSGLFSSVIRRPLSLTSEVPRLNLCVVLSDLASSLTLRLIQHYS